MPEYIEREAALAAITEEEKDYDFDTRDVLSGLYIAGSAVKSVPAADVELVRHGRWVRSKKHKWKLDRSGKIDLFACESDFHNGPECEICYATPCVNCKPDWEKTICSVLHFECSECGEVSKYGVERYCGGCGAKMDKGAQE